MSDDQEYCTLGAGCFWCVEAVLEQLEGVHEVTSGYMGGAGPSPTYKEVCSGKSGHAEVVQLRFEPSIVSYDDLLGWFFRLHDPTQLDRQGNDVGSQYRSAIFTHGEAQARAARQALAELQDSGAHASAVVTRIDEASEFWPAEGYHQDYYRENREQPYCRILITPKLEKLGLEP